ncbi:reverse transcriptase (RNA-dependent DNA polymerase) domain-containing protein [Phthorimaea operculella]|nr:reverse transcriptase (RNA-dependent DNA polymerase) domain-containing protein [Phthorimaea operculella]
MSCRATACTVTFHGAGAVPEYAPGISMVMYADDTNAVVSGASIEELNNKLNYVLGGFQQWFSFNALKLNANKTNILLFKTTSRYRDDLTVGTDNDVVSRVDSIKFLGVHLDSLLNWKQELAALKSSISSACYAIKSLREESDITQLKMVYHSLVESKLRYSIACWGNSYEYNLKDAFVIQKRAIRTIVRVPQIVSCKDVPIVSWYNRCHVKRTLSSYKSMLPSDLSSLSCPIRGVRDGVTKTLQACSDHETEQLYYEMVETKIFRPPIQMKCIRVSCTTPHPTCKSKLLAGAPRRWSRKSNVLRRRHIIQRSSRTAAANGGATVPTTAHDVGSSLCSVYTLEVTAGTNYESKTPFLKANISRQKHFSDFVSKETSL